MWFLITAIFFWLLIKLSKKYTTAQKFSVTYINLPQDKLFQKKPVKEIIVNISGTGFKLLRTTMSKKVLQLDASTLQKKTSTEFNLFLPNQQIEIQNQLPKGIQVENFIHPIISLQLGFLESKKIPILQNIIFQYKAGYDLVDKILLTPDSLLVTGPKFIIDTISKIFTKRITLTNVSEDISKEVLLNLLPKELNIKTNIKKVLVVGKVEKYTEGTFEIPFIVSNLPFGKKIIMFPKNIKVVFKIPLKDFNKIERNSFSVECNYKESVKNNLNYLIPKIKNKPKLVKSVKIVPNKVDFLIQK